MPSTEGQKSFRLVMNTQRFKGSPRPRDRNTGATATAARGRPLVTGRKPIHGTDNQFPNKKD